MTPPLFVENKEQVLENISQLEGYLSQSTYDELAYKFVCELIKKGVNFACYKVGKEWHFAPSRFIGYQGNNMKVHQWWHNHGANGSATDQRLNKQSVLGPYSPSEDMDKLYFSFCESLGLQGNRHRHQYWVLEQTIDTSAGVYTEGAVRVLTHMSLERNPRAVADAKRIFRRLHKGHLYCTACGLDPEAKYGDIGKGIIEAHHIVPVASRKSEGEYTIDPAKDFVMLCPTCHRLAHNRMK